MSKLFLAWAWLRKNWHWVVLPVGAALYLLGRAGRRNIQVVSPALVQHELVEAKAESEAAKQMDLAKMARDKQITHLNQDHDKVVANLKAAEARTAEVLADDPVALERFLKQVDKDIKG